MLDSVVTCQSRAGQPSLLQLDSAVLTGAAGGVRHDTPPRAMRGACLPGAHIPFSLESKDKVMRRHVLFCLFVVFATVAPAVAQFETANVLGTVRDSSGG